MGTERRGGGLWPDADEEGQYYKEKAYGTTDVRLVDSDRRSYVLQFGHVIDNPTSCQCGYYCEGSRQWLCSYFLIL